MPLSVEPLPADRDWGQRMVLIIDLADFAAR